MVDADKHPVDRAKEWDLAVVGPERVRVREDEFGGLVVSVDGEEKTATKVVLAFPISGKSDCVSFLDDKGAEVALVGRPEELEEESREAVRRALERMYYVPKIVRIDAITETWGVSHWKVETDCGYAVFEVVAREHIRRLRGGRFLIQDADGNRFEIESTSKLDKRSQELIHSET